MKHSFLPAAVASLLCVLVLALSACGTAPASPASAAPPSAAAAEDATLSHIYGEDYVRFVTDTVTMQMENRTDKTPETVYYPVRDQKPLTDYVDIDDTTACSLNENGDTVVILPAGSVADESLGAQTFILPKP